MPIGTVYRPPPRKRSSTGLGSHPGDSATAAVSPSSPSLPAGRAQSDLEARIAEFSVSNGNPPNSPSVRPTAANPSAALPPKPPVSPHRSSVPIRATAATPPNVSSTPSRPVSAPTPPIAASLPPSHYTETASGVQYSAAAYAPQAQAQSAIASQQGSRPPAPSPPQQQTSDPRSPNVSASMAGPQVQNNARVTASGKILIVYYSMYGHVRLLADSIRQGVESVPGCSAEIFRVPETLSPEVLKKMNAPPKHNDPELTHDMLYKLREADGIMFGIPTRFGMMPAQMKSMFDSTVKLWTKGDLVGKPAGLFFSTATQGGGQETTALTTITQLVHHGMIYVPPGYSFGGAMFNNDAVHGGSPYGCGTIANGDGSRLPSKYELEFARHQGAQFALVALKLAQ